MKNYNNLESVQISNIKDYCETARNVAEKLNNEWFFAMPDNYDGNLLNEHMTKILNSYEYISFMVGILNHSVCEIDDLVDKLLADR